MITEKTEVPFNPGKYLEDMYNRYISEGTDMYEFTLNSREIKLDILEFLERLVKVCNLYDSNLTKISGTTSIITNETLKQLGSNLLDINNQLGSSIKIFIKILGKSGIEIEDIFRYYDRLLNELNLADAYFFESNLLKTIFCFARHINIQHDNMGYERVSFNIPVTPDNAFTKGCRLVSEEMRFAIFQSNMLVCQQLITTLSHTKDPELFQMQLMEALIHIFNYYDLVGLSEESLLEICFRHED